MCIFTGQAPTYNKITIEKIALNSFMREAIDPATPAAYWSDMSGIDDLPGVLEERNIPATHSFYAGQHLCNHILYSSLHLAKARGLPHKSGLIHVPVLPEQTRTVHRDAPYMPLEISRKALSVAIRHVHACSVMGSLPVEIVPTSDERGGVPI
jgi:pyroglutamyl-peptidase